MKKLFIMLAVAVCGLTACSGHKKKNNMEETTVRLETTMGNITVKLYDETPKHRDNFIKLVKQGMYDGTLFHRVIRNFMIQAGDPESKTASDTASLGSGDVGYTIPAEFNPGLIHKKGALAAARKGDEINPQKESSGCQFYIVTGQVFSEEQLLDMEQQMNDARLTSIFNTLAQKRIKEIYKMRRAGDNNGLTALQNELEGQAREIMKKETPVKFTSEQIQAYTTIGGAPHLDGSYTVFGEVVDGMDVIERIQEVKTNGKDRPEKNIRILKAVVEE